MSEIIHFGNLKSRMEKLAMKVHWFGVLRKPGAEVGVSTNGEVGVMEKETMRR